MSIKMYGMVATLSMFLKKFARKTHGAGLSLYVPYTLFLAGPSNDYQEALWCCEDPTPPRWGRVRLRPLRRRPCYPSIEEGFIQPLDECRGCIDGDSHQHQQHDEGHWCQHHQHSHPAQQSAQCASISHTSHHHGSLVSSSHSTHTSS